MHKSYLMKIIVYLIIKYSLYIIIDNKIILKTTSQARPKLMLILLV